MSTDIGKTQRRILDELAATNELALTVTELAGRMGVSDRQVRGAVHALADRGLVVLTKENHGRRGTGENGPRPWQHRLIDDPNGSHTRYEGSHWGIPQPGDKLGARPKRDDGMSWILGTPIRCRVKWYRGEPVGMPADAVLFVWLPENRATFERRDPEITAAIRAALGL